MATFIKAGFWEKLCKPCRGYKGWLNLDELIQSLAPPAPAPAYKVYTALLVQQNDNAPGVQVIQNTLGGDISFQYILPGVYYMTLPEPVTYDKLWISATNNNTNLNGIINYNIINTTVINITSMNAVTGLPANNIMYFSSIEIRIYP